MNGRSKLQIKSCQDHSVNSRLVRCNQVKHSDIRVNNARKLAIRERMGDWIQILEEALVTFWAVSHRG
jgi:hypothetical protein